MFKKDLNMSFLLDFYGELLSDRKHSVMDMYYNEDLSLAEISEEIGISRQGVRDIIKKSEEDLTFYEEKLGLAKKLKAVEDETENLRHMSDGTELPPKIRQAIERLAMLVCQ